MSRLLRLTLHHSFVLFAFTLYAINANASNTGLTKSCLEALFKNARDPLIVQKTIERIHPNAQSLPEPEQIELISQHLYRRISNNYSGAALETLKNKSLREVLSQNGFRIPQHVDPYAVLKMKSKRNLNRVFGSGKYVPGRADMKEVEEVVNRIQLRLQHSTALLKETPNVPILSSRQIKKIGFNGGINSQYYFNREFLKTDDHVFFAVDFAHTQKNFIKQTTYGQSGIVLNSSIEAEKTWISPYLMHPQSLLHFTENFLPKTFEQIQTKLAATLEKKGYKTLNEYFVAYKNAAEKLPIDQQKKLFQETFKDIENEMRIARYAVADFTFTPSDFETLARNRILFELNLLRVNDPKAFESVVHNLPVWFSPNRESVLPRDKNLIVNFFKRVKKRFDFMGSFEGKVPVSVSPENIIFIQGSSP